MRYKAESHTPVVQACTKDKRIQHADDDHHKNRERLAMGATWELHSNERQHIVELEERQERHVLPNSLQAQSLGDWVTPFQHMTTRTNSNR
jgi:hypothetical protein